MSWNNYLIMFEVIFKNKIDKCKRKLKFMESGKVGIKSGGGFRGLLIRYN